MTGYNAGLTTLKQETQIASLPVQGAIPEWVSGTLVRNGPGAFEVKGRDGGNDQPYAHWFDGLGMLHAFTIAGGKVSYANRYLRSIDYTEAVEQGKIVYSAFATDPCRSVFQRMMTVFSPKVAYNANVNVAQIAGEWVAMTETPIAVRFDPKTLETLGVLDYPDTVVKGQVTTAHPHFDFARRAAVNYQVEFGRKSRYVVYEVPEGERKQRLVVAIPAETPAYMHTFAMTEHAILLVEFPLVVNPLKLMFGAKPFIQNYIWTPERGTRFHVIDRRDGSIRLFESEAFFAFHHVNAFEENGDIFVDVAAYPDPSLIDAFYLKHLRAGNPVPQSEFRRYHLPKNGMRADYTVIGDASLELPRIDYRAHNGKPYRYAYAVSNRRDAPLEMPNALVKIDTHTGNTQGWHTPGHYPGEPIFLRKPGSNIENREDDGILLAVVLDGVRETSYLLLLDATTMDEIARADVPHAIPFGFHGQFM